MKKFKDFRQFRLPDYDYSSEGAYFVTICVNDRANYFGKIRNGIMGLNDLGCISAKCWQEIPSHFSNVILDEWVIMPDHMHGIIQLLDPPIVGPPHGVDLQLAKFNQFGKTIPNSISSIINQFKGSVKRWSNDNGHSYFSWQSRFNDHIIRNENELNRIRQYIKYNPLKWELKKDNDYCAF